MDWIYFIFIIFITYKVNHSKLLNSKIAHHFQNTDIVYRITKGNELKKFGLVKRHGVWSLHFRQRLKSPEIFLLEIEGRIPRLQAINGTYEKPLKLFINLEVTQLPS